MLPNDRRAPSPEPLLTVSRTPQNASKRHPLARSMRSVYAEGAGSRRACRVGGPHDDTSFARDGSEEHPLDPLPMPASPPTYSQAPGQTSAGRLDETPSRRHVPTLRIPTSPYLAACRLTRVTPMRPSVTPPAAASSMRPLARRESIGSHIHGHRCIDRAAGSSPCLRQGPSVRTLRTSVKPRPHPQSRKAATVTLSR